MENQGGGWSEASKHFNSELRELAEGLHHKLGNASRCKPAKRKISLCPLIRVRGSNDGVA